MFVWLVCLFFFFQAEDGIRYGTVTGVQTCALPIWCVAHGNLQFRQAPQRGWLNRFHTRIREPRHRSRGWWELPSPTTPDNSNTFEHVSCHEISHPGNSLIAAARIRRAD